MAQQNGNQMMPLLNQHLRSQRQKELASLLNGVVRQSRTDPRAAAVIRHMEAALLTRSPQAIEQLKAQLRVTMHEVLNEGSPEETISGLLAALSGRESDPYDGQPRSAAIAASALFVATSAVTATAEIVPQRLQIQMDPQTFFSTICGQVPDLNIWGRENIKLDMVLLMIFAVVSFEGTGGCPKNRLIITLDFIYGYFSEMVNRLGTTMGAYGVHVPMVHRMAELFGKLYALASENVVDLDKLYSTKSDEHRANRKTMASLRMVLELLKNFLILNGMCTDERMALFITMLDGIAQGGEAKAGGADTVAQQLHAQITLLKQDNDSLRKALGEVRAQEASMRQQLYQLQLQLQQGVDQNALHALRVEIAALSQKLELANATITSLNAQIETGTKVVNNQDQTIRDQSKLLDSRDEQARKDMAALMDQAKKAIQDATDAATEATNDQTSLRTDLATSNRKVTSLTSQLEEQTKKAEELDARCKKQTEEARKTTAALLEKVEELQGNRDNSVRALLEANLERETMRKRLRESEEDCKEVRRCAKRHEAAYKEIISSLSNRTTGKRPNPDDKPEAGPSSKR